MKPLNMNNIKLKNAGIDNLVLVLNKFTDEKIGIILSVAGNSGAYNKDDELIAVSKSQNDAVLTVINYNNNRNGTHSPVYIELKEKFGIPIEWDSVNYSAWDVVSAKSYMNLALRAADEDNKDLMLESIKNAIEKLSNISNFLENESEKKRQNIEMLFPKKLYKT